MLFLGIDCGTQSLKVVVWGPEHDLLTSVSQSYDLIQDLPPGHKEQHPRIWIEALDACMALLRAEVNLEEVQGIGVSGQQHGLVALDSSHVVVRPAKLWCDTSTQEQCDRIVARAGDIDAYQKEIGNALPPGFTASKILWIKDNEPVNYKRIRFLLLPHDYLNLHLTGELVAEPGDASGTGYFRVRERVWSPSALAWIDPDRELRECLPRLIRSDQMAGQLRAELASKWGMGSKVIVSAGGGDNMMGAIGSGNVTPGTVTVSLGTSGTLYCYSETPVIDPQGEIAAFCDSTGGWLPLGCTMNVTVATEMIREGLAGADLDAFSQLIEQTPPGAEGLVLLPYLEGERMPNIAQGTGVLLGLRPKTASAAHLARASMEGVTMGLAYALERLGELGVSPAQIRLIGGGSKSRVWRQIAADVFGVPVVCPGQEEGPAFGAALQAMWCCQRAEIADLVSRHVGLDEATQQSPNLDCRDLYSSLYKLYKDLSRTMINSDVFQVHRDFIERKD